MGHDGQTREMGGILLDDGVFDAEGSDGDDEEGGDTVCGGPKGGRGVVVAMD
jgi:hypothetical protein